MKRVSLHLIICLFLVIAVSGVSHSQTFNSPVPPENNSWEKACASENFNQYSVNFTWSPNPIVASDNLFILELSDADGNFDNPFTLASADDRNTDFDFNFDFSLPENVSGDNYRMRVRGTNPEIIGPPSAAYPMYYLGFNIPLRISQNGSGNIPQGGQIVICDNSNVTLGTHNVPNIEDFNYIWYRQEDPNSQREILSERSSELNVTQPGIYSIEIDYGTACTGSGNTASNNIQVTFGTSSGGIEITSQSSTEICSDGSVTLEASINNAQVTYTWYKDGTPITAPTNGLNTYTVQGSTAGFAGSYYVEVSNNGSCIETSNNIEISNAGGFDVAIAEGSEINLVPGETTSLSVTTNGINPRFTWFRDSTEINGETSGSLTVDQSGEYYVEVEQDGPCPTNIEVSQVVTVRAVQNIMITISPSDDYSDCNNTETTLSINEILAQFEDETNDVTNDLIDRFAFQWLLDGNPVSDASNNSLAISNVAQNGIYSLTAVLESFTVTSNETNVLLVSESYEINSNETSLCDGNQIVIQTNGDLNNLDYEWQKDAVAIDATGSQITIDEPGSYRLVVTENDCSNASNSIEIVAFDESAVTIDIGNEFFITPGTTTTATASGADTYEWYDESDSLVNTGDSFSVSQPGEYRLEASRGNCSTSLSIVASLLENFEIPNVITPNGDSINDQWVIPNTFSGNEEVAVVIYDQNGQEIYRQANYQNNWPESSIGFTSRNLIFYYIIERNGEVLKRGTITVIR